MIMSSLDTEITEKSALEQLKRLTKEAIQRHGLNADAVKDVQGVLNRLPETREALREWFEYKAILAVVQDSSHDNANLSELMRDKRSIVVPQWEGAARHNGHNMEKRLFATSDMHRQDAVEKILATRYGSKFLRDMTGNECAEQASKESMLAEGHAKAHQFFLKLSSAGDAKVVNHFSREQIMETYNSIFGVAA